jgi:hypothetical protein
LAAHVTVGNFSNGITNSGMITAGAVGVWVGGRANTDIGVDGTGASFSGNPGASVTISNFSGGISNSGTISTADEGFLPANQGMNGSVAQWF